jgi:hypothetical protein
MTNPEIPGAPGDWSDEEKWQLLLRHERLGELLVTYGSLTIEQLHDMLAKQPGTGKHIGEMIVEQGLLSLDNILETLKLQHANDDVGQTCIDELKERSCKKKAP